MLGHTRTTKMQNSLKNKYDIIIIGSGVGGGTMAKELIPLLAKGYSVLMLEQGPYWKKENFSQKELEMSQLYYNRGAIFSKDMNIAVAAGSCVGGSSTVYTGVSFRPPKEVLNNWRQQHGINFLTDDFCENTLSSFEKELSIQELPASFDNDNNKLFKVGCDALGIKAKRLKINIKNCEESGFCNLGCKAGAKQGTMELQLPQAMEKGMDLIFNATVTSVTRKEVSFSITQALPKTEKNSLAEGNYSVTADVIIISAGALHSPALLLASQKSIGIKNKNIGRYITLHPAYNLNGIYKLPITNYRGFPKTWYVDQFSQTENFYLETSFYYPGVTAKNNPHFGKIHEEMMLNYNKMMSILILTHDEPLYTNRITIDKNNKSILHYQITPAVKKSLTSAIIKSAQIFFAAGCEKMMLPGSSKLLLDKDDQANIKSFINESNLIFQRSPLSSAHPQGGCRMGSDPENSVTDTKGNLHGTDNIFIADASLFPTSSHVNPYLTIMLLTKHIANQIKKSYGITV